MFHTTTQKKITLRILRFKVVDAPPAKGRTDILRLIFGELLGGLLQAHQLLFRIWAVGKSRNYPSVIQERDLKPAIDRGWKIRLH